MMVLRKVSVASPTDGSAVVRDLSIPSRFGTGHTSSKELADHVALPALVNAHDHLHQNVVPPLPQAAPFRNSYEWAAAFRGHFDDATVKAAVSRPILARLWQGGLKNALCGATTVMHHDPAHGAFDDPAFPVWVLRPYAWAHSLHWRYGPDVVASFRGTPAHVPWFIHLAEGVDGVAAAELQELRQLECLGRNSVLIHAVGLDDSDLATILRAGASVIWCPSSNLSMLGRTIAPGRLRTLFEAGSLALGTDSRLTGAPDLLAELVVAAAHSDFSARELLQLATCRARRVLRAPASDDWLIFRKRSGDPFAGFLGLRRAELRAIVRAGEPLIADPDFKDWFAQLGIPYRTVSLDGQPKLCRTDMLSHEGMRIGSLEPGLTLQ